MNGHEPRWDHDVKWGAQGELRTMTLFEWIARGNGHAETKTKRRLDFEIYVEEECFSKLTRQFEPSGIRVTEAEVWVYHVGETGIAIAIPTDLLRQSLDHQSARHVEEKDGDHPTRGRLVNLGAILDVARRQGVSPR